MFIRRTVSKSKKDKEEKYYTYRLVESYRVEGKVRQRVLLNLGSDFSVEREHWATLANRIDDILHRRESLFAIDPQLESLAQQYALQLTTAQTKAVHDERRGEAEYCTLDLHSLEQINPRSIGCEHVVYETIKSLRLVPLFESLCLTPRQIHSALGILIAKACHPGSEAGSIDWLRHRSGAGELYDCDYEEISDNSLYRIADTLLSHKEAIEGHLYEQTKAHFGYDETLTLYDLTNTYFEGKAEQVDKARRGRSKEKRSDAKLITLAIVLDSSGFIRHSRIFAGNVSEPLTLREMIEALRVYPESPVPERAGVTAENPASDTTAETPLLASAGHSLIVMDAGIASEANIDYLKEQGYAYLVVSRKREKQFDEAQAVVVKTDRDNQTIVRAQRVEIKDETGAIEEVELYCHSQPRALKENAMQQRIQTKFIQALESLNAGLTQPRRMKNYEKVLQKVGALTNTYASIAQYYTVTVTKDPHSPNALSVHYKEKKGTDQMSALHGVYCLRTNNTTLDAATLWRTYTTLTDLEGVFRTLKSELGLRPIYHRTGHRVDGHLFITLLTYTVIHTIRYTLKAQGMHESWNTLRERLSNQVRTTTTAKLKDGRVLYLRKSSLLDEQAKAIVNTLGISQQAGGVSKVYR